MYGTISPIPRGHSRFRTPHMKISMTFSIVIWAYIWLRYPRVRALGRYCILREPIIDAEIVVGRFQSIYHLNS
jgi:hypothetical protein